jgi:predicted PurR-regulated permease PerM
MDGPPIVECACLVPRGNAMDRLGRWEYLPARLRLRACEWATGVAMSTERERLTVVLFYGLAVLLAYLVYQLFRPFLVPLAWSAVLVICFYPTHCRFERRWSGGRAALLSTASVALLVIVPMLAVASAFVSQASWVLESVPRLLEQAPGTAHQWLQAALRYVPGGETIDAAALLADSARRLASFLSGQAAAVLQNTILFFAYLVVTIFAMFFLFRDAAAVMHAVRRIVPLEASVRERLIEQIQTLVTAGVTSSLIVAAVQGILGGLTFWALGLSAPVFWGVIMAVCCLLPFGAWIVWAPAAIWLLLTGDIVRGLLLAGIGVGIVSGIDNVLRPMLLSERSEMNGLVLFVSLLGGLAAFGTVGLVLGPVLMGTAVGVADAYASEVGAPPRRKR